MGVCKQILTVLYACLSRVLPCRAGDVQGYKRVDGPSDEELQKKHEEGRKNSPFSNPSREPRPHHVHIMS